MIIIIEVDGGISRLPVRYLLVAPRYWGLGLHEYVHTSRWERVSMSNPFVFRTHYGLFLSPSLAAR